MKLENWIRKCPGQVSRIEACFTGNAYSSHRHDDYTIALTTGGVQSFNYRGTKQHSLAGQAVILHPDEAHDGMSGTDGPFVYRAISIDPMKIQEALLGRPLPFIEDGVVSSGEIVDIIFRLLGDFSHALDALEYESLIYELAIAMNKLDEPAERVHTPNIKALKIVREFIEEHFLSELSLDSIAEMSGYSKWHLSRDFKTLYGTSPYQYVLCLRLCFAQSKLINGSSLIDTAYDCRFSDQSHFTRKFKQRFGVTPKKWLKLLN